MKNLEEIVIITGSSGFIGHALAKKLANQYQIVGIDQGLPANPIAGVDYRAVNMTSDNEIERTLTDISQKYGKKIVSVIHLVAYYSFDGVRSPQYLEVTVNGTRDLLDFLNQYFTVEQFIFSSTMLVHAPGEGKITEDSPLAPRWAYPESKVDAEEMIDIHRHNIPVVNLRIAGVYEDSCHSIPLSQHIARIHECQLSSALFPGNAQHGQSLLHLQDLVTAIELLISRRKDLSEKEVLILGEEEVMSYTELQSTLGKLLHDVQWPSIRVPRFFARFGAQLLNRMPMVRTPFIRPWMIDFADDNYDLDISRVKNKLNWEPERKLKDLLPGMIVQLKQDPEGWYKAHKIEKPKFRSIKSLSSSERRSLWTAAIFNMFLGLLLIANPLTFSNVGNGEKWSDIISGVIVILVSAFSLLPSIRHLRWLNALIGAWLMLSPLVFWTNSSAIYAEDTLIGGLILLFAAYTPSPPGENEQSDIPPGWSYNPSTWPQRLPIMLLAFLGFLMARYLAAFQLDHITNVWDPFFGNGSEVILKSDISRAFPVSDGGLGAMSYLMDVIAAAIGDRNRWRTMPWMVVLFGLFIIPTGVTSITLVMLQPIGVGAWCSICLFTALIMLMMVPPSLDEVIATVQYLRRRVKAGDSFWKIFWQGGPVEQGELKVLKPEVEEPGGRLNVIFATLLGAWLMYSPEVLNLSEGAANNIFIVSALVVTVSVIAYADVSRMVRFFNIILGVWLIISAWLIGEMDGFGHLHSTLIGMALIAVSWPRGRIVQHFGTFDPWVRFYPAQLFQWWQQRRHNKFYNT